MNDLLCYLNGEYTPISQAKVSVLDRGFIFGDGIYEVVPVYGRRIFRFDEHMARMNRSLAKLRIPTARPRCLAGAQTAVLHCRRRRRHGQRRPAGLLSASRAAWRARHVMPPGLTPTVLHDGQPMKRPPRAAPPGVACVTARDFAGNAATSRGISLLGNVLARQISADHGALETIMFRDGWLTEAAASNVWIAHEGALLGPPRVNMCWRASASSCCASCARSAACA